MKLSKMPRFHLTMWIFRGHIGDSQFAHPSRAIDRSRVQSDSLECWEVQCQSQRLDVIIQQFSLKFFLRSTYTSIYMILFFSMFTDSSIRFFPIIFDTTRSPPIPNDSNKVPKNPPSRTLRTHRHPSALDGINESNCGCGPWNGRFSGWWVPKSGETTQGCIEPL